ncbi:unnamed protein product, partial [Laminaria digitata]
EGAIEKETETLEKFYESVRMRAAGIDNAEGKQRIIVELYDRFFKTAFPKMVEQLGIVYTPVEVVDFILHSVSEVLKQEFGQSLTDENVHILDPFTGTGTFITRLLQSGLIDHKDLARKYARELHANEIVLLAYYIAAVNIENAYHDLLGQDAEYQSFDGICLTDTFQLGETESSEHLFSDMFPQNSERVERQKQATLRVILGNPPYSAGQKSANDNAQNQKYQKLDARIAETYAAKSSATLQKSLYDSYIKAFRWATDRLDKEKGGIIGFVSNGAWLDGNAQNGFRKQIAEEFGTVYVFNLRGNARTQGELRRKEKDNVFGQGTRTTISITLLVKKPDSLSRDTCIYYHDIGDYLKREEKLSIISGFKTVTNPDMKWQSLKPNTYGDWINQRKESFNLHVAIGDKKDNAHEKYFVPFYSNGVKTNRDAWVYNFSEGRVETSMRSTIDIYNGELEKYIVKSKGDPDPVADKYVDFNRKEITWTREIKKDIQRHKEHVYDSEAMRLALYRPFVKQYLYFDKHWNNTQYQIPKLFPTSEHDNLLVCLPAPGGKKDISVLITDVIPDLHVIGDSQCFPLYYYEQRENKAPGLFDEAGDSEYIRHDGITDFIFERVRKAYGKVATKEDIFYYVYGFLHSPDYRETFKNDLKKMLPRLPLVDKARDFWAFSTAG